MVWLWLAFAFAVLIALFAFTSIAAWVHEIVMETGMLRDQRLWRDRRSTLFGLAIASSCSAFFAPYIYILFIPAEGITAFQSDLRFWGIFWYSLAMIILTIPLWIYSFVLAIQARRHPSYVFLLPQDAKDVRIRQCIQGMYLATILLPDHLKEELLDPLIRAIAVSSRAAAFPQGKRGKTLLTNDFSVYCNLAVEASHKGYQGILRLFDEDQARYEGLKPLIQAYPDVEDSGKQQLTALAVQLITGESGESGAASAGL